jgi:GNAT superfamily N-acetyltransferase
MSIEYRSELPSIEQFWSLFLTTGWNQRYQLEAEQYAQALAASWFCVCAYQGERLVGVGRIVSDGVVHAMIYDMIVEPEYQGQGIGAQILTLLVQRCQEAGIRDIQLFCAKGMRAFYEKHGFKPRPDEAPGMQWGNL